MNVILALTHVNTIVITPKAVTCATVNLDTNWMVTIAQVE